MGKTKKTISHLVTYKNSRFYTKDNKRLVFSERKEFQISGYESDFLEHDEMLDTHPLRPSDAMESFVKNKYGEENVIYMLPAGTKFNESIASKAYFRKTSIYLRLKMHQSKFQSHGVL